MPNYARLIHKQSQCLNFLFISCYIKAYAFFFQEYPCTGWKFWKKFTSWVFRYFSRIFRIEGILCFYNFLTSFLLRLKSFASIKINGKVEISKRINLSRDRSVRQRAGWVED